MRKFITTLVTVGLLMGATAATASARQVVNQGDRFYSEAYVGCTIGYVEEAIVHTAGHCGDDGDIVYFSGTTDRMGVFHTKWDRVSDSGPTDYGYIVLDEGVEGGKNIYSGDKIVDPSEIEIGDVISSFGASSNTTYTGTVAGGGPTVILGDALSGGRPGDSGGPSWIEGKGFVGTFRGTYSKSGEDYAKAFTPIKDVVVGGSDTYAWWAVNNIDSRKGYSVVTGQPADVNKNNTPKDEGQNGKETGKPETSVKDTPKDKVVDKTTNDIDTDLSKNEPTTQKPAPQPQPSAPSNPAPAPKPHKPTPAPAPKPAPAPAPKPYTPTFDKDRVYTQTPAPAPAPKPAPAPSPAPAAPVEYKPLFDMNA